MSSNALDSVKAGSPVFWRNPAILPAAAAQRQSAFSCAEITAMRGALNQSFARPVRGRLFLKRDGDLPVVWSTGGGMAPDAVRTQLLRA